MATHLVKKHLERVSGKLFEEYQGVISTHARGQSGVYVLYSKRKIYYVGLASNLNTRLKQHLRDRHKGNWDTFSMYLTRNDRHLRELEALFHRVLLPSGNKQTGKLKNSLDLKKLIAAEIKSEQSKKLNDLIGLRRTAKNPASKMRESTKNVLAGYFSRATSIRGWHKDYEYRARVLKSDLIRYDKHEFYSPSGAAKFICKKQTNGWYFWHYKDAEGNWIRLNQLKK